MLCDLTGLCDGFLHTGPFLDLLSVQRPTILRFNTLYSTHGEHPTNPPP
jgi:hypothetical protein